MKIFTTYKAQYPKNGSGRIYITQRRLLELSGLSELGAYETTYGNGYIEIRPSAAGKSNLYKTARGTLLELKDKSTAIAIQCATKVLVMTCKGLIKIVPHPTHLAQIKREASLLNRLSHGAPLTTGSLFTGLGLLNLHLSTGLKASGVATKIKMANDICPAALSVNTATNPIWEHCERNALVVNDDIRDLHHHKLPTVDILDISYPCNGQSKLITKDKQDLAHPVVGTLFMPTVEAIKKCNPAVIVIECTPLFNSSTTLELIQRELQGYTWLKTTVNGHDHGEIEKRERACVIAVSEGLISSSDLATQRIPAGEYSRPSLVEFLEPDLIVESDWKEYAHVVKKAADTRLSFKHETLTPSSQSIPTIVATYSSPKVGAPFISHDHEPRLMRPIHPLEHANIRRIPAKMKEAIKAIVNGTSALTNAKGSKKLAHRLLGMSVAKRPWLAVGAWLGQVLNEIAFQNQFK